MEYSDRIKKIEELLKQMEELGVSTLSVAPGNGCAYLDYDDQGDLREVDPTVNCDNTCTIREAISPRGVRMILVQTLPAERVYRKTWGLDDGDK